MQLKNCYDKKIHADNARWRIKRRLMETKLCPIFKKNCKGDECMSFEKGITIEMKYGTNKGKWKAHMPHCSCALVTGYIEAEMTYP